VIKGDKISLFGATLHQRSVFSAIKGDKITFDHRFTSSVDAMSKIILHFPHSPAKFAEGNVSNKVMVYEEMSTR